MMSARTYGADLQALAWIILRTAVVALFVALLLRFSRAKPRPPKTRRSISLRISNISESASIDEIEAQLKLIADLDVKQMHPLLRMNERSRCTIVDVNTSLAETELRGQLNAVPGPSPIYDCDFYGITPLSENENTKVE